MSLRSMHMSDGTYFHVMDQVYYNKTSVNRTPMGRLPWFIQTRLRVPGKLFR